MVNAWNSLFPRTGGILICASRFTAGLRDARRMPPCVAGVTAGKLRLWAACTRRRWRLLPVSVVGYFLPNRSFVGDVMPAHFSSRRKDSSELFHGRRCVWKSPASQNNHTAEVWAHSGPSQITAVSLMKEKWLWYRNKDTTGSVENKRCGCFLEIQARLGLKLSLPDFVYTKFKIWKKNHRIEKWIGFICVCIL